MEIGCIAHCPKFNHLKWLPTQARPCLAEQGWRAHVSAHQEPDGNQDRQQDYQGGGRDQKI